MKAGFRKFLHYLSANSHSSINAISEHHYQTGSYSLLPSNWPSIATDLTNKANIRSNLAPYAISVLNAQKSNIPFLLGETNTFSGHGQPGVSNSAAAALWMVDYSLQAASIGITGLQFHQGIGYNYSGGSTPVSTMEFEQIRLALTSRSLRTCR